MKNKNALHIKSTEVPNKKTNKCRKAEQFLCHEWNFCEYESPHAGRPTQYPLS